MRILNDTEMNFVVGGVDPIPGPGQGDDAPMPEVDRHWLYFILPELYPPTELIQTS